MKKHNLAFIDLETTGLDPERHEIIEIGAILARQIQPQQDRLKSNFNHAKKWLKFDFNSRRGPIVEVIEEFELKVIPERIEDADPQALRINGYTPEKWTDAMSLGKAIEIVAEKTQDAIMIGQNVTFDWIFLSRAFVRVGIQNKMHYHRMDLMSMAFARLYNVPEMQRFSLRELCIYFGVENEKAHTALSDIRATYEVYKKLLELS